VASSRQDAVGKPATRRFSIADALAALLIVGWCVLGTVKIERDIADYRAEEAAAAVFYAPPPAIVPAAPGEGVPDAPYDPSLGRWLIGEAAGYLVTLALVVAWRVRSLRRRRAAAAAVKIRWIAPSRAADAAGATRGRASRSGAVAAGRLSVVVWNDQVERKRA
jgi:hypothetical protein